MEDFVGAKFYCPHALADGNQHIRVREETLKFSSTVLPALSPYRRLSSKFAIKSLNIPLYIKCVATIPCEIFSISVY